MFKKSLYSLQIKNSLFIWRRTRFYGVQRKKTPQMTTNHRHTIRHFRNEKGTGAEMCPAMLSGIVTGDTLVNYWPFPPPLAHVPSLNSPRRICES